MVTSHTRELTLVAIVVALMLAFTVQIRRGEPLPTPPAMLTVLAEPPPPDATPTRCPVDGRDCRRCCADGPCAPP